MAAGRRVSVRTGARLHAGMFAFGRPDARQFGGLGLMIDRPGWELSLAPSERFAVVGPQAERVSAAALRLAAGLGFSGGAAIEILNEIPAHAGLGSGTQLHAALAAGLAALRGDGPLDLPALVRLTQRGRRSAIGLYGFVQGGLLVEAGRLPQDDLAPLCARLDVPANWRFVLVRPRALAGVSGAAEVAAFAQLPPTPVETTAELTRIALLELLPAFAAHDAVLAGAALTGFGRLAGSCFAAAQGGFYHAWAAPRVERVLAAGCTSVFQSSWGPTLVGLCPDEATAENARAALLADPDEAWEIGIAQPLNQPAVVEASAGRR